MRVFLTLWDRTGAEPAQSGWVNVRSFNAAREEARRWQDMHLEGHKGACTRQSFTVSRRKPGQSTMVIEIVGDFDDNRTTLEGTSSD